MPTMLMNPPSQAPPARKPLPSYMRQASAGYSTQQAQVQQPQAAGQYGAAADRSHTRTRTASSTAYPPQAQQVLVDRTAQPNYPAMNRPQQQQQQQQQPVQAPYGGQPARRTLSSATSSTSSTSTSTGLSRAPTGQVRRSTSSRSNGSASPSSYVALMRKQKATVWCDRAQHEDPRILAAQRQAKMRAAMEVAGGAHHQPNNSGRTSTSSSGVVGGVRSKIRHHGAVKAQSYQAAGNLSGAGVPMRLSASEVDEGDSDEEPEARYTQRFHQRNGSGRSSLGSGQRMSTAYSQQQKGYSNGSSPVEMIEEQTPVPRGPEGDDYFAHSGGSGGSGGSVQREDGFGAIAPLPHKSVSREARNTTTAEDLMRRGSVDERTMTMSGVRLFVANPDVDD